MFRFAVFLIAALVTQPLLAEETVWELKAYDIVDIYDGDTFYVRLSGLPAVFGESLPIRPRGVDTPEMRSRCPTEEAKTREKALAAHARDEVYKLLTSAETITLYNLSRGSFFRVVADVRVDGIDLRGWLIERGYSYAMEGTSTDQKYWCDPKNFK